MSFLYFLAAHRTPALTNLAEVGRYLGENIILILILCEMYWCRNKKAGVFTGYVFVISGLLCQDLKLLCRIPRPWILDPNFKPLESALGTATGYSFPSGHTQTAVSIYGTMAGLAPHRTERVLFCLLFVCTGFSRMYAGVHTPWDVGCAMLIALIIVWAVLRFLRPILEQGGESKICRIGAAVSVISLLFIVTLVIIGFNTYELSADAAKISGAAAGFFLGRMMENKHINFTNECTNGQKSFRLILGLIGTLAFEVGCKSLLAPLGAPGDFLRYAIVMFFILAGWPAIFTRMEQKKA